MRADRDRITVDYARSRLRFSDSFGLLPSPQERLFGLVAADPSPVFLVPVDPASLVDCEACQ